MIDTNTVNCVMPPVESGESLPAVIPFRGGVLLTTKTDCNVSRVVVSPHIERPVSDTDDRRVVGQFLESGDLVVTPKLWEFLESSCIMMTAFRSAGIRLPCDSGVLAAERQTNASDFR